MHADAYNEADGEIAIEYEMMFSRPIQRIYVVGYNLEYDASCKHCSSGQCFQRDNIICGEGDSSIVHGYCSN